ncbi:NF-kappa-B inhibitor zeta [Scleropages formosus]|uniref:NF-kappa-B inhibitor zeta n=1 Tax=Scleropages formosus TaxID=113540 RepID=UPI0010FACC4A|nr:NF-kappa-B inhibitor zeta [Scleropages formosus]
MIIERGSEDFGAGLVDQDWSMMSSPCDLWSFYGNSASSSSPPEHEGSTGSPSPRSPSCGSESGKKGHHQGGSCTGSPTPRGTYQGVRVKNPVKELIMQKRVRQVPPVPSPENEQVEKFPKSHDHCPALITMLQGTKRPAASSPSGMSSPKRCATYQNSAVTTPSVMLSNVQVNFSNSDVDSSMKEGTLSSGHLLDITSILQQSSECSPVSMATLQVQESPCHPQLIPASSLPHISSPLLSHEPSLYVSTDPLTHYSPSENLASCLHTGSPNPSYYPQTTGNSCLAPEFFPPQLDFSDPSMSLLSPVTQATGSMSFFQWQIQQEEKKLQGLSPEQLMIRDGDGDTFLHIAVAQGRRALAYVLARKMADINVLDLKEHNSQSALQVGVAANQHLIVQDLLTLGAQVNTADCWGRTPLHVCAEKGHALMLQAIHRTLQNMQQQLNIEAVNYDGLTALHTAVLAHNAVLQELGQARLPNCPQTEALLRRRKLLGECISTLLSMGASYKTKDLKSGRTALHIAAEEANVELLRLFLDQPDSLHIINEKAYNGNTVLHVASSLQGRVAQVDTVKLLMRRGADPSSKNLENENPAHLVPEGPLGDQVRRILKGKGARV